jgi:hypothetical protein
VDLGRLHGLRGRLAGARRLRLCSLLPFTLNNRGTRWSQTLSETYAFCAYNTWVFLRGLWEWTEVITLFILLRE